MIRIGHGRCREYGSPMPFFFERGKSVVLKESEPVFRNQPQIDEAEQSPGSRTRNLILWIDGVGGFLMLDRDELLIGQAVSGGHQDIGLVGDLSRQAAVLKRVQADYLVQPLQETCVDGKAITGAHLLTSGATLSWGPRVRLKFTKPHPLSCSARLDLASHHRFQPRVDGVILLADSCILGPSPSCHVQCSNWKQDLLLFRSASQWYLRAIEEVEVNGISQSGQVPLVSGVRVRGSDFSFSLE